MLVAYVAAACGRIDWSGRLALPLKKHRGNRAVPIHSRWRKARRDFLNSHSEEIKLLSFNTPDSFAPFSRGFRIANSKGRENLVARVPPMDLQWNVRKSHDRKAHECHILTNDLQELVELNS